MKSSKNAIHRLVLLGLLLIAYHVLAFVIPFSHTGMFWLAYSFTLIAIADTGADLSSCLSELQQAVVDGDKESALTLCRRTEAALAERNRLCKLNK